MLTYIGQNVTNRGHFEYALTFNLAHMLTYMITYMITYIITYMLTCIHVVHVNNCKTKGTHNMSS